MSVVPSAGRRPAGGGGPTPAGGGRREGAESLDGAGRRGGIAEAAVGPRVRGEVGDALEPVADAQHRGIAHVVVDVREHLRRGARVADLARDEEARLVRKAGAEPSYETTFDNLSSQAVAARLGLRAVASALSVRCAL